MNHEFFHLLANNKSRLEALLVHCLVVMVVEVSSSVDLWFITSWRRIEEYGSIEEASLTNAESVPETCQTLVVDIADSVFDAFQEDTTDQTKAVVIHSA